MELEENKNEGPRNELNSNKKQAEEKIYDQNF